MASVYHAHEARLDRHVALKVVAPQIAARPGFRERLLRAAREAMALHHPNIVPLLDVVADGDLCYLVSEFVAGPSLAQRLQEARERGERLATAEAVRVAQGIGAALDLAHRRGVVHGRLSTGNIHFSAEGEPLLADFGFPSLAEGMALADWLQAPLAGTYLSPEQAKGQPATRASDVYSLGVVLYEMVAGQPPFLGGSPLDVVVKHMSEPPAAPQVQAPVPLAVGTVLLKALAKEPEERYLSGGALAAALAAAAVSGAAAARAVAPPAPEAEPPAMPETGLTATLGSFVSALGGSAPPKAGDGRGWLAQTLALLGAGLALVQYLLQVFDLVNRPLAPIIRALPGVIVVFFVVAGGASILTLVRPAPARQKRVAAVALGLIALASASWGGWRYYDATRPPKGVIVLVAEFQGQKATKGVDWGRRIYTRVKGEIARLKLDEQVEVRRVFESYDSSEQARRAGEAQKATLVLWGWYDDLAVSPHFEMLRSARPFQERLIAAPVDLVDFDLYARQGPHDMAYITDVVLGLVRYAEHDYSGAVQLFTSALEAVALAPTVQGQEAAYLYRGIVGLHARLPMEAVVADLQEAARLKPDMYQAHWALAIAYTGYCTPTLALDAALAEAREVVRLRPQDANAHWLLGQVYLTRQEWPEAEAAFRQATARDAQNADAFAGLGRALAEQGRMQEANLARAQAVELRRTATSGQPQDPAQAIDDLGVTLFGAERYDEALAAYQEAVRLQPNNAQYHRHLGDALYWQGRPPGGPSPQLERAIAAYEEAVKLDPLDSLAWSRLGGCYVEAGRRKDALHAYEEAVRLAPCDADGLFLLATQYDAMGDGQKALEAFQRLTLLQPSQPMGWDYVATDAFNRGDYVAAEAAYRQAVRAAPEDATLRYGLASSLYALGRYAQAAEEYQRTAALAPDDGSAYAGLGDALARLGRNPEAVAAYRRSLDLDASQVLTWISLGLVYEADKKWGEAEAAYAQAVACAPDQAYVRGAHARTLWQLGRLADAVAEYERAAALEPAEVSYPEQIALGYAALNQADRAAAAAEAALRLNPQSALAHLVLAGIAEDRGDAATAREHYALALKSANDALRTVAEEGLARVGG
ncbi:MAG: tetratricopeptide repeat protein [Anaerolineae bacterium]